MRALLDIGEHDARFSISGLRRGDYTCQRTAKWITQLRQNRLPSGKDVPRRPQP